MKLFKTPPKQEKHNPLVEAARVLCAEEGIPLEPSLESRFQVSVPHAYHCGGECPALIWFREGKPEQCPVCGRRVSEMVANLDLAAMPQEVRMAIVAEAHLCYSSRCFREGKFAAAETSLTRVIELYPDVEDAYHNRAQVRNAMNNVAGGIEDCDAVMRINPNGADTLVTRAGLKLQVGDQMGAINDATAALEKGSKKPFAYFARGVALLQTNRIDEARGDLRRYLSVAPSEPRSAMVREILAKMGG